MSDPSQGVGAPGCVYFMTGTCLHDILCDKNQALGEKPLILVDEFDSLLLTLDKLALSLTQKLPQSATIIALSGSEL